MAESADIVPLPERAAQPALDEAPVVAPRTRAELLVEAALALPNLVLLLGRLLRDRRVPRRRKVLAAVVVAYVVSPIDLVPDFIPVLGQVDDVVLVALAVDHLIQGTSHHVVAEHWSGSEDALELVSSIVAWAAELVPASVRKLVRW